MTDHLRCPPSSTLASSLRQEWTTRLRRQQLHGLNEQPISAHELLTRLQGDPGPARDRLWLSLLELDGPQRALAHRILLQAMLNKALRLARTCHGLQVLEDRAGREAVAVTAMWEAIRTYPTARLRSRVTGNIALTALRLITRAYPAGQAQMHWLTPMTADELDLPWAQTMATGLQPQTSSNAVTCGELFALLSWARDHQVLTREEARLLGTYSLCSAGERQQLADRLGVQRDSLTRRMSRCRIKVLRAVQDHGLTRTELGP
jgi:hypothetical protein